MSFEIMDRLALSTTFAFDHDFRDGGYAMVPEPGVSRADPHALDRMI